MKKFLKKQEVLKATFWHQKGFGPPSSTSGARSSLANSKRQIYGSKLEAQTVLDRISKFPNLVNFWLLLDKT